MELESLRDRILGLLPPGTTVSQEQLTYGPVLTLHFDPQCAGNIERTWPRIFQLCEECGCGAVLISTDLMKAISVLDTKSGAPNYHTENALEVKLVLSQLGVKELQEAA
jgi:hypothetical protein